MTIIAHSLSDLTPKETTRARGHFMKLTEVNIHLIKCSTPKLINCRCFPLTSPSWLLLFSIHQGTIGLLGIKSPPFFTHGRMMRALSDQVQDAPFYVDKINKKVAVDFGNSLPIDEDGNMDTILKNKLLVAVHLDNNDQTKCSDNLIKLGVVLNKDANWYETSAGVQIFPDQGSLSDDAMSKLADHPLVVAEVIEYCT